MRVEKAKENYLARLHREWTAKPDEEDEEMTESDVAQDQSMQTEPLRIPTPASGFVKRKVRLTKIRTLQYLHVQIIRSLHHQKDLDQMHVLCTSC